jgi:hypothetical protein
MTAMTEGSAAMFAPTSHLRDAKNELRERRVLGAALAVLASIGIIVTGFAVSLLGAPSALVLLPV